MPIQYRVEPERELIRVVITGAVGEENFEEYRRQLAGDPGYSAEYARLFDLRGVSTAPTTAQIRSLVHTIVRRALPTPAKRAIVVSSDVSFGMFRMLGMLLEGHTREQFRVFRAIDDALRWLAAGGDADSPPLPPNGVG